MRTGTTWDVVAVAALVAPLAGLLAPLAGASGRRSLARAARWGALAAAAGWTGLLAAAAAPEIGAFAPDGPAMAAAAGAALLAAIVTLDPPRGQRPTITTAFAAPLAAVAALAAGAIDPPTDPSRAVATAMVVGGAVVAAAAVGLAVGIRRLGVPLAVVAVSPALLLSLRGGAALAHPVVAAGLVVVGLAAGAAVLAARRPSGHGPIAIAACLLVAAVGAGPVAPARPWAALLAAGVVVVATGAGRWTVLALGPGAVGVVVALADVRAAGDPDPIAHLIFAAGVAVTIGGVALAALPPSSSPVAAPGPVVDPDDADWVDDLLGGAWADGEVDPAVDEIEPSPFPLEVRAAVAVAGGWLVLAPGSWRWAVADPEVLAPWDRAAAVAIAATAATAIVVAATGQARSLRAGPARRAPLAGRSEPARARRRSPGRPRLVRRRPTA